MYYQPTRSAPDRLSLTEANKVARARVSDIPAIRRLVRSWRVQRLPRICSGWQSSWALVIPPHQLTRLIAAGRIAAEKVRFNGWSRWEIRREDVAALAAELNEASR